jgi:pimeloyl-ACP methyl ester carboxylesterase/predicted glycosyltransferase
MWRLVSGTTIAETMSRQSDTRAREPDLVGLAAHGRVRVAYESFGEGERTLLFLPSWTIVNQRQWKAQVPYFARHCRCVTFDPRGNGSSDRPDDIEAYSEAEIAKDALAVLDALGIERAALVALSSGAVPALILAAEHPERVSAAAFIGSAIPFGPSDHDLVSFDAELAEYEGWERFNRNAWRDDFEGFCEFFFTTMFPEPHSTRQIECGREWARGTTGEILAKTIDVAGLDADEAAALARRVRCPVLVLHGDQDDIRGHEGSVVLAAETGGRLVTLAGSGHAPTLRDPVRVNLLLREFLLPAEPPATWRRARVRPQRALFVSSPIGLGHARRDIAIARELRRLRPGLEIDWLAQPPTTALLAAHGERVHPASAELAGECAHIESEAGEHRLPVFDALRRMDEILIANFMLFHDVARDGAYDLWIGDEAWEVDHFLHENPELKCAAYAWLTDFVGFLPLPSGGEREAFLTADYNAEMIEQVERYPHVRDRAIFVGDPDDIVPRRTFGPGLPAIRPWVEAHYDFSGHITGFDPSTPAERSALRRDLGWGEREQICLVAVGGSGVGVHLLQAVLDAAPAAQRLVPGLRMVGVCGPRIDPAGIDAGASELHGHVPDLHRMLEACDIAVVQGGLTTTMELVAAQRPFLAFPLEDHFEQQLHVAHRLVRHNAGRRMEYATATPATIADALASDLARGVNYLPVAQGGAARAAALIAPLLAERHSGAA